MKIHFRSPKKNSEDLIPENQAPNPKAQTLTNIKIIKRLLHHINIYYICRWRWSWRCRQTASDKHMLISTHLGATGSDILFLFQRPHFFTPLILLISFGKPNFIITRYYSEELPDYYQRHKLIRGERDPCPSTNTQSDSDAPEIPEPPEKCICKWRGREPGSSLWYCRKADVQARH